MWRLGLLGVLFLAACDEPVGPQPDKPIRAAEVGAPQGPPPGPPARKPRVDDKPMTAEPGANGSEPAAPKADDPPAAPPAKCPADSTSALAAKAKWKDAKKKKLEVTLSAKSADVAVSFAKPTVEDGKLDEAQAGNELVATVTPESAKAKVKLTTTVFCASSDRQVLATVDAKSLQVSLKEIPKPPEPGFLTVAGEPGMKVSESGKELGVVPLRNFSLAPGKYQVKVAAAKGKGSKTFPVEIKSGQTANLSVEKKQLK